MSQSIRIGLLRLVDSAPVVVADARGLFAEMGLDVTLSIEPSWSNAADKLAYGMLDAAVMLPPLVLAAAMGLRGGRAADLIVPMGLTQGGNAIVLSSAVAGAVNCPRGANMLDWLRRQDTPPRFAVVHHYSTHNLLLRYWLALAGANPEHDIETVVVPPEQVVQALADGRIAGFCAGAPWGDVAQASGAGQVMLGTSSIWPFHPEKCLAVRAAWADRYPVALRGLLRALLRAQVICDRPDEAPTVAALLGRVNGLNLPEEPTRAALPGGTGIEQVHFHAAGAWFPATAHAEWFLGQMRRWGWFGPEVDIQDVATSVYRPDLLAAALAEEDAFALLAGTRRPYLMVPPGGAGPATADPKAQLAYHEGFGAINF